MLVYTFLAEIKFLKILYELTKSNSSLLQDFIQRAVIPIKKPILFGVGHSVLLFKGKINFRNKKYLAA